MTCVKSCQCVWKLTCPAEFKNGLRPLQIRTKTVQFWNVRSHFRLIQVGINFMFHKCLCFIQTKASQSKHPRQTPFKTHFKFGGGFGFQIYCTLSRKFTGFAGWNGIPAKKLSSHTIRLVLFLPQDSWWWLLKDVQYALKDIQYALKNIQYALKDIQYALKDIQYALKDIQYALKDIQCVKRRPIR